MPSCTAELEHIAQAAGMLTHPGNRSRMDLDKFHLDGHRSAHQEPHTEYTDPGSQTEPV